MKYTPKERYLGYLQGVISGDILAGSKVRTSCERTLALLERPDVYFDEEELGRFVALSESLVISDGSDHAGKPVRLMDWQIWVLGSLVALKWTEDDAPVLKESYAEVARGAGKSAMAALLAIHWALERPGIDVNVLSGKQDQSAIIVNTVKQFLDGSPDCGIEYEARRYDVSIGGSTIRALAAKTHSLDGLRGKFLCDEAHEWRDNVFGKVLSALPKGRHYQMLSVSTPGGSDLGLDSIYYQTRVVALECLKDFTKMSHVGSFLYGIDDYDDLSDETCWPKGQPSLCEGGIIRLSGYRAAWEAAVASNKESEFERYQACRYSLRNLGWIDLEVLDGCSEQLNIEDFKGKKAYIGLDLSKSFDLSSMCVQVWEHQRCHAWWWHWVPAEGARDGYRQHKSLLGAWERQENVTIVDTPTIDYDKIRDRLLWACEFFDVPKEGIGVDALGGLKPTLQEWEQEYQLPLVGIPQTITVIGPATFSFESLVREGKMTIHKDAVLEHAIGNVQLMVGQNGDRRPTKEKSTGCIDPVIAGIQATAVAIEHGALNPPAYRKDTDIII